MEEIVKDAVVSGVCNCSGGYSRKRREKHEWRGLRADRRGGGSSGGERIPQMRYPEGPARGGVTRCGRAPPSDSSSGKRRRDVAPTITWNSRKRGKTAWRSKVGAGPGSDSATIYRWPDANGKRLDARRGDTGMTLVKEQGHNCCERMLSSRVTGVRVCRVLLWRDAMMPVTRLRLSHLLPHFCSSFRSHLRTGIIMRRDGRKGLTLMREVLSSTARGLSERDTAIYGVSWPGTTSSKRIWVYRMLHHRWVHFVICPRSRRHSGVVPSLLTACHRHVHRGYRNLRQPCHDVDEPTLRGLHHYSLTRARTAFIWTSTCHVWLTVSFIYL